MPTTTNGSLPSGLPDSSGAGQSDRSGGAAGVEIPVIVHASRYSAAGSSVGKALPPIHEETRTVIVFDQGAVVRLSGSMIAGEVVVLTNKLTGADVICKVANVKAQSGIQNYVSLEFTQRAPGFWGQSSPSSSASLGEPVQPVVASPALTARVTESEPPSKPAPAAVASSESSPARPPAVTVPAVSYEPEPVASIIAESIGSSLSASPEGPHKAFSAGSTLGIGASNAVSSSVRPIEFSAPLGGASAAGKKIAVIGVAAVALLGLGGVGGWLLLRPAKPPLSSNAQPTSASATAASEAPAPSQTDAAAQPTSASVPTELPVEAPLAESSNVNSSPEPPVVQPAAAKSSVGSLAAPGSPASAASVPAGVAPAISKTAAPPDTPRRPAIDVTKMAAPSVKSAVVSTSSDAPPELLAQPGTISGASGSDNLLASAARSGGPAAPVLAPSKGGQLVPPKLISASAAVYPALPRAQHVEGEVILDVFVDATGKVAATKVISGPSQLQQAAMNAVRTWTYQPARLDGQAISIHIRVNVSFHLQ